MCWICVSGGELSRRNRGTSTAVCSPDGCWCSVNNDTAVPNAGLALNSICDDGAVDDVVTVATGLIAGHPAVQSVKFAGSRSRGTHELLSDWDFAVETFDFDALAHDLPALVAPLEPLGQQWEPMGHFPVYQVFLRGPTKIEYLFLDPPRTRCHHSSPIGTRCQPSTPTSGTGFGGSPRRPTSAAPISSPSICPSSMPTS